MKTILLIGSKGFIGSYLRKDLKKNYKLLCPKKNRDFDITDLKKVNKFLKKKIDIIINLSGQETKTGMFKTIVKGNKNIIHALKKQKKSPQIYYISTTLVYGFSEKILDERSKTKPLVKYAKLKKLGEYLYLRTKLDFKILRLANVYDHKKKGIVKNIINSIIRKTKLNITNLNASRNYIHVKDLSKIIKKMLEKKLKNKIYNIGHENLTINQIIRSIEKRLNIKVNVINKGQKLKLLSSQKIKKTKILREIKIKPQIELKKFMINEIQNEIKLFKK